jgi:hypothetical protein
VEIIQDFTSGIDPAASPAGAGMEMEKAGPKGDQVGEIAYQAHAFRSYDFPRRLEDGWKTAREARLKREQEVA